MSINGQNIHNPVFNTTSPLNVSLHGYHGTEYFVIIIKVFYELKGVEKILKQTFFKSSIDC